MPRNWWSRLAHDKKTPSRRGALRKRSLHLESLEERLAPAHLSYQGGPVLPNVAVTSSAQMAQTTTTETPSPVSPVFGQPFTLTATVASAVAGAPVPTGTVTFMDGSATLGSATLSNGSASFSTTSLTVGAHSITAVYSGDGTFATSTSAAQAETVGQDGTTVSLSPTSAATVGQSVTFTATVAAAAPGAGMPSGTVTFMDGSTALGSGTVTNGTASFTTSLLTAGSHSITAVYGGDSDFTTVTSSALTQTVSKIDTTLTLSPTSTTVFGQKTTFTATVSPTTGSGTPSGTVTFMDGSTSLGSATLSAGSASFSTTSLTVGAHSITAVYSGDSTFATSTSAVQAQTVGKDGTTLTLSPTSAVTVGQSVTFTATVAAAAPGAGMPSGTVTFMDGSTTLGTGTITNGIATFSSKSLTAGSHSITAVYGGDSDFTTVTSSALTQTVSKIDTTLTLSPTTATVFGQEVTFTATVSAAAGSGTPSGDVTFMDGSNTLGSGILKDGIASFSDAILGVAMHHITAVYSGDSTFATSTSSVLTQTVGKDSAKVTLSPASTATVDEPVTFTATVAATTHTPARPGGTVTFMDGSTILGTGTITNGIATFSTRSLTVGSHSITAVYSGDGTFTTATSPAVTQVVNLVGTTVVLSSTSPTAFGQRTTFTALVHGATAESGTPSGTVTFMDGSTVLGSATLKNGSASLTLSGPLAPGNYRITAVYKGEGDFAASSSAALPVTVGKASTATTLLRLIPGVYGQSMIFQVRLALVKPANGSLLKLPSSILNGTVTFMDGSKVLGSAPLKDGGASFGTAALSVGAHSITAVFGGNSNLMGSTSAAGSEVIGKDNSEVTLHPLTSAGVGQPVTFTATVGATFPGSGTPSGIVTFLDGNKVLGTATIKNGSASFTTSLLALGNHSIKAVYGGDANFTGDSSAVLTKVIKHSATITLSSTGTTVYGQQVSFTAKIHPTQPGSGMPSGTVTFLDGSRVMGTVTLRNETATFSTTALTGGSHTITAVYNGGDAFGGNSTSLTQMVDRARVRLEGSVPTRGQVQGRPVIVLGVTVHTVPPGAGVPVGTVSLSEGSKTLGTLALDGSGRLNFLVSGLSKGTHWVSASYSGNINFQPSAAMLFRLTV
jgi:hypothetical protein